MPTLLLRAIKGIHLVLRDQSQPAWRPEPTQEPATVEVWMSYADEQVGTAQLLDVVVPGQTIVRDYTADLDRPLRFTPISVGVSGARSDSLLSLAESTIFTPQRETEAPTIGQVGDAGQFLLVVGIDGFSRAARYRKVEVADDVDMSVNLRVTIKDGADQASRELPRFENITRESGDDALTQYVRVSHSSGGAYGAASDVLEVAFADRHGGGGTSGDYDPTPHGHTPIEP